MYISKIKFCCLSRCSLTYSPQFYLETAVLRHYQKRKLYHITPSMLFFGFALGNNSIYVVVFVKYQNAKYYLALLYLWVMAERQKDIIYLTKSYEIALYLKIL